MQLAVVGHVEVVEVVRVDHAPRPGETVEALGNPVVETGGMGAIAARQIALLGCPVTFFTAFGDDEPGRAAARDLRARGLRVEARFDQGPQRRGVVLVDEDRERAIVTIGEKRFPRGVDPLPWQELGEADAVCLIAGDEEAIRAARQSPVLVASARWLPVIRRASVQLDALVHSSSDPAERYRPGDLSAEPRLVVTTMGASGGRYVVAGGAEVEYRAETPPAPPVDSYGCGDSFLGGLTFALAGGAAPAEAVAFAARCGAACLTGAGLSQQLRQPPGTGGARVW
jgi:ribokinase